MAGKVYLVGAGPGDPGLITMKGVDCLREADVVVYDRLVNDQLLDNAAEVAERIYVGKKVGSKAMEQEEINELMVARAKGGATVVRLKGGDPFVFGRGGEEVQALAQAEIPFEVVPGVTSAIAAPAYAGIPLTHRRVASSFTVVSGTEDPSRDGAGTDWSALARSGSTLVVLMGWDSRERVFESLIDAGMEPSTPAALVQWGSTPRQRKVVGNLSSIARDGEQAGISAPVVAIIGDVVGLHEQGGWFDKSPIFGKRVLVTRSRSQASTLVKLLQREGAQPVELPAIQVSPIPDNAALDAALKNMASYSWVVFTSANAVEIFFGRMMALGLDSRALGGTKIAAIGKSTASSLNGQGIRPDILPVEFSSQSLVAAMSTSDLAGKRVLLPRGTLADDSLPRGLQELGAQVDDVGIYDTTVPEGAAGKARDLLSQGRVDVATFTSASTVTNLLDLLNGEKGLLDGVHVGCIGPVTASAARERGLDIAFVAQEHTIEGLVDALKDFCDREEKN